MRSLRAGEARALRARGQGLGGGVRHGSVAEVVERVVAVQAQDTSAAALGIRVRATDVTAAQVRRAAEAERSIVRGWFMRGTLQLVPAADVPWLLGLLGPVFLRQSERRHRELGLDEDVCARAEAEFTKVLAEGPATRAALTGRLAERGLPSQGQAPFHLIRRAALRGVVCHGPELGGEAAFVLLPDWLPARSRGPKGEQAETELAARYLRAYAPAAPEDFATWSGLPLSAARRVWRALGAAGRLVECEVPGGRCALLAETAGERAGEADGPPGEGPPDVRLLPAYDNYLLGYRSRSLSVPSQHERQVWPGGGQIRPTVLMDGLAYGTWAWRGKDGAAAVSLFDEDPDPGLAEGIAAETAYIRRFLGAAR
ncbi:winged helix DNA-binding domain-containing protein [Streptomyces sp. NPDC005648]|uniref:winged helix DNA-binding domain-containing protein n=1 Tax=Streptomyces sp. NPDC005648 TaxID=3157044 RepID=UPI0033ACB723